MIGLETAVRLYELCQDVVNGGKGVSAEHQHRAERTRNEALENVKAKGMKSATGTAADVRGARGGLGKRKRKSRGEPLHTGLASLGSDGVLGGSGGGEEEADSDDDDDGRCSAKEQTCRDVVGKAVASGNPGRQLRSARRSPRSYEPEDAGGEELVKTLAGYIVRKMAREEEKEREQEVSSSMHQRIATVEAGVEALGQRFRGIKQRLDQMLGVFERFAGGAAPAAPTFAPSSPAAPAPAFPAPMGTGKYSNGRGSTPPAPTPAAAMAVVSGTSSRPAAVGVDRPGEGLGPAARTNARLEVGRVTGQAPAGRRIRGDVVRLPGLSGHGASSSSAAPLGARPSGGLASRPPWKP
ncbi:unnamed protein product [Ectocarpus sp. CCAP 1310/34]|nr:unnamed protein product [Ectocarpus sp. CCAP 1310/34]